MMTSWRHLSGLAATDEYRDNLVELMRPHVWGEEEGVNGGPGHIEFSTNQFYRLMEVFHVPPLRPGSADPDYHPATATFPLVRPADISEELRSMTYHQLKERMISLIESMPDGTNKVKANQNLSDITREENQPSCGTCGSKASPLMRLWLSRNSTQENSHAV